MEEICQELHDILYMKFDKHFKVEYDEVEILGKWFFIRRKNYAGFYRLGMFSATAISFVRNLDKLPSDLIEEK